MRRLPPRPRVLVFILSFCRGQRDLKVPVSVNRSVRPFVGPSYFTFFAFLGYLEEDKFSYEYFMDINAPAQFITAPAQLITAPPNSLLPLPNCPRQG